MKTRSKLGQAAARLSVALLLLTAGTALAQTKTWVGNGAQAFNQGIWGGNANWSPSGPANGADNTAYFTTLSKETQAWYRNLPASAKRACHLPATPRRKSSPPAVKVPTKRLAQ